jgi:predicted ATPase
MPLHLQNLGDVKKKLNQCQVHTFLDINQSYKHFLSQLKIHSFRKLNDVDITFDHPVTVIAGTNTVGKTSILILLACSYEKFLKHDSTSPSMGVREHAWNDMLSFTSHESDASDYSYELNWRVGAQVNTGWGKRNGATRSWSGLGKKSSDKSRTNAKIREREVRFIDLERVLPGRSFSNTLFRKANAGSATRLNCEIEQAFEYVFDCGPVEISEVASHINKTCFLVQKAGGHYSSFNAASGEESVLYLLKDIIDSPKNALVLIDEVEAGFHPAVQRKIADIVQYISWRDKKQFVITTHSPTFVSSFPLKSRVFIESTDAGYVVTRDLPSQAVRSKMDTVGHPLVRLYLEDDLAEFLVSKALLGTPSGSDMIRAINIIKSGPVDQVANDYVRHKRNFSQYRNKVGCCGVMDGDYIADPRFSSYEGDTTNYVCFIYPHEAPEKFLVRAYLSNRPNAQLQTLLAQADHHSLFAEMVRLGLAADENDARNACYREFSSSAEYSRHVHDIASLVERAIEHYSRLE